MEIEGLLPCSQESAAGLYSESDASNPHLPPYFPKIFRKSFTLFSKTIVNIPYIFTVMEKAKCVWYGLSLIPGRGSTTS